MLDTFTVSCKKYFGGNLFDRYLGGNVSATIFDHAFKNSLKETKIFSKVMLKPTFKVL